MGRIATSFLAVTLVLSAVPVAEVRLWAAQQDSADQAPSPDASAPKDSGPSAPTSTVPSPSPNTGSTSTTNNASAASALQTGGGNTSGAGTANPGSSSARTPAAGGDGTSGPDEVSMGPSEVLVGPDTKKTTFFDSFLTNPLNLILLLFVAFYVFLLLVPKPGQKEQKVLRERLAGLKKNDRVVLNSGIHGVVANINTEAGTVSIRVDEGTNAKLTVDRSSIRSVAD